MRIEEIVPAFLGKELRYNGEVTLHCIDECGMDGDRVYAKCVHDDLTCTFPVPLAKALASEGVFKWWGQDICCPVCGVVGTQVLKLVAPRKRRGNVRKAAGKAAGNVGE